MKALDFPTRPAYLLREQHMPLPRLWHNKAAGKWEPVSHGTSIFDPKWNLGILKKWAETVELPKDQPIYLDIEDVHPTIEEMQWDARPNWQQIMDDTGATSLFAVGNASINAALRLTWLTVVDTLIGRGFSVSAYGHPCWRASRFHTYGWRSWLFDRMAAAHPVLYENLPTQTAEKHAERVRVHDIPAARVHFPLRPVLPFISHKVDDGSGVNVSEDHLVNMVKIPREMGCAGVVFWYHVDDTRDLTKFCYKPLILFPSLKVRS